jgi:hypothetical protein
VVGCSHAYFPLISSLPIPMLAILYFSYFFLPFRRLPSDLASAFMQLFHLLRAHQWGISVQVSASLSPCSGSHMHSIHCLSQCRPSAQDPGSTPLHNAHQICLTPDCPSTGSFLLKSVACYPSTASQNPSFHNCLVVDKESQLPGISFSVA